MRSSLRALVVAACVAVAPDIVVPGTRWIPVVTRVDPGPLADQVRVAYEVRKGDTLTAIARQQLGAEKRLPDLVAANPGVDPNQLKIGQLLWLPAKDPAVKDAPCLFVSSIQSGPASVVVGKPVSDCRYGSYELHLVPTDLLADLASKDDKVRAAALASPRIVSLSARAQNGNVEERSPAQRAEQTLQVCTDKDGKLAVRTKVVWFGADGKELPVDEHGQPKGEAGKPSAFGVALLTLAGGAFLVWRGRLAAPHQALA